MEASQNKKTILQKEVESCDLKKKKMKQPVNNW